MNRRPHHPSGPQDRARPKKRRGPLPPHAQKSASLEPRARRETEKDGVKESIIQKPRVPVYIRYNVVFYDNHAQAKDDKERLLELKNSCDQLNIIIKAEGSMDDPELLAFGKIYAGEAWTLIHRRRVDEGWYLEPREAAP